MNKISYQGRMDPQMAEVLKRQKAMAQEYPDLSEQTPEQVQQLYADERRFWNEDAPSLSRIEEHSIYFNGRDIPMRVYFPDNPSGNQPILFLHGGGWVVGNLDTHDKITRLLAIDSGHPVLSIDYALAPRHQFPVAINEVLHVMRTLSGDASRFSLDGSGIAMAGDSAGANLCASCTLLMQSESPTLVRSLALYYGGYGLKDSASRRVFGSAEDGLRPDDLAYYQRCYLGNLDNADDPRYAIVNNDLSTFPSAFIAAASLDPLLDDSRVLSLMLEAHSIEHDFVVYEGVLHGFLHMSRMLDKARSAITHGAKYVAQALD